MTKAVNKTTIDNLDSRIKVQRSKLNELQKKYANESNDQIKQILYNDIQSVDSEINDLVQERDAILESKKKSARQVLDDVIKNNEIAYIASDDKYILIRNYSDTEKRVNLAEKTLAKEKIVGVLNVLSGISGTFDDLNSVEIRQCFERNSKSFLIKTSSFDKTKWREREVYNTILQQKKFWAPIWENENNQELITDDYDPAFDDVLYSLAGGKAENIEYIEKWVAFKRLYPEKCKITPGINITGVPGGNGKGMFGQILTSIFTDKGVSTVKAKNFTGGFNQILEGKVIGILDDEDKNKFPHSELKQVAGNQSIVIEPKGVDAYSVDSTANIIVFDNTGLVKLVGGGSSGEDRRWGIVITNSTLLEVLQNKYQIDINQARSLAKAYSEQIFEDRIACGRWLAHLIRKYNVLDMDVLAPLHGEDYQMRLAEQKDEWTEIFDQLLPVIVNQGFIPFKFVREIIEASTGDKIKKPATLSKKFDEYMTRKGFKNVEKTDINYKIGFGPMSPVQKDKGAVRRIDTTSTVFDYKLISNAMYAKNVAITKDTLQIRDFNAVSNVDNQEENSLFTDSRNQPRYPATPLEDEDYE
jgi:hypothetical protein